MGYRNVSLKKERVFLVTGGAGFIGSNLCEALLDMGHVVRCMDNLSTGKIDNIQMLSRFEQFTFLQQDIRDIEACTAACQGVDYVLHQAAWGSVPRSIEMPLLYEQINSVGMLNMLEAARQAGVQRFVYASSSSVYGDAPQLPKKEGYEGELLSPYAVTKRTAEEYGKLYHRLYGLPTYGLRYFNVFGRRQNPVGDYAAVIPRFISLLLRGEIPLINGDGQQSRDFTYIDNVVEANLKACAASEQAAGQVYNIAYGAQETLTDVYWVIARALNMEIPPRFGPSRLGDIRHSNADITRAKERLSYAPEYSFEDGIRLTIDWYKENL